MNFKYSQLMKLNIFIKNILTRFLINNIHLWVYILCKRSVLYLNSIPS